jgi:2-C-methyl-D-erythritol 4-phosphate cytidylyltransferase
VTRTAVLVPAAGRGERLGPGTPKALRELAGVPMLVHAVHALAASPAVDLVVIAAPESEVEHVSGLIGRSTFAAEVSVVSGGATRQESVARALITLPQDVDIVLVHDAARPLVPVEMVTAVVASVREGHPCVIPCLPVTDTIKEVDSQNMVVCTVDREVLRAVQTPQGFDRLVLQQVHAEADPDNALTDDAGLVEAKGIPVHVIPGHAEALKITRPFDITIAEALIAKRRSSGSIS